MRLTEKNRNVLCNNIFLQDASNGTDVRERYANYMLAAKVRNSPGYLNNLPPSSKWALAPVSVSSRCVLDSRKHRVNDRFRPFAQIARIPAKSGKLTFDFAGIGRSRWRP